MSAQFEASALAHRIAVLDEIGAGPLWVRRDALLDMAAPATAEVELEVAAAAAVAVSITPPMANADAQSNDAAWDDDGPVAANAASAPLKTALTLCTKSGANADAADPSRYLFIARASSVQGADELFDNILLALGLQKEARVQGDLSVMAAQIAAHKPSVLIVMEPAAALQLVDGDHAAFDSLRGRMHRVGALPALVTYGAVHLLRNPADKRKVWDDLCLLTTLRAADVVDPA
ncbi:MAG: uracil-DNA glycosylase [Herbaspirillum sp.]|nr:uracil-DNA glycosylase [Herbaspirillum sp.]